MTDPFHPRSPEPKELDAALARLLTPPSAGPPAPSTVRGLRKTLREERARLWCAGPIGTPLGAVLTLPRPGRIEMLLGTPLGPADDPTPTGRCLEAALKSGRQTGNHLAQLVHVPEAVGTAESSPLSIWAGLGWGVGAGRSGGRLLCRIGVFGCGVRCVAAGTAADSLRASGFVASEAV